MRPQDIYNELANSGASLQQAVEFTDALRARGIRKQAFVADAVKAVGGLVSGGRDIASTLAPLAKLTFAIPPVAGYVAGDLLARQMDADSSHIADIQEQELVAELRANAEALRRRQALREKQGIQ